MSKKACEKKELKIVENPVYECKKCGARVKKEEKVCKPRKM